MEHTDEKIMLDTANHTRGRKRMHKKVKCDQCNKKFWRQKRFVEKENFCCRICSGLHRQARVKVKCTWCGKDVVRTRSKLKVSRSGLSFCNRKCKEAAQSLKGGCKEIQPTHYGRGDGKHLYRKLGIEAYGNTCEICGWEHSVQVHHIDNNRNNNDLNNLCVLCPNCHSVTKSSPFGVESEIVEGYERKIQLLKRSRKKE